MSFSWASFSISFSICVFLQYANPESLPFAIVAYPARCNLAWVMLFAMFASFVGIVFMGTAVAMLNLRNENSANQIDTRINTSWGGILSLLPVLLGFTWGMFNIFLLEFYNRRYVPSGTVSILGSFPYRARVYARRIS